MALRQMEPTMVQVGGMDFYITPFRGFGSFGKRERFDGYGCRESSVGHGQLPISAGISWKD